MNAKNRSDIINWIFVVCALAITGMYARREFFPPTPPPTSQLTEIKNWRDFQGGQALTSTGGPVRLVVFSDYECPACRAFSLRLDTIRGKYPTQLSVYYRNLPLPYHAKARPAAFAAECAAIQGKFRSANKLLFADVDSIGSRSWGRFAALAEIADTTSFISCVRDSLPARIVLRDEADAKRLNVRVTPTLLLDNVLVSGVPSASEFDGMIEKAIKANKVPR